MSEKFSFANQVFWPEKFLSRAFVSSMQGEPVYFRKKATGFSPVAPGIL